MPTVADEPCRIDDVPVLAVRRPTMAAEVGDEVRRAAAAGHAVFPAGGRTMLDLGLPPDRPGVLLDLGGLAAVVDYPARDMTVTVEAGVTLAELARLLATENQRLPIDVPDPHRATLGGALAVNVSGPRRDGFGTLRDYVIGMSTINDEGHEVKAGGRVVKNVAGYDLCKLHVGALGTLGIITRVTLKVRPLPETQALVTLGCEDSQLAELLERVHQGRTRPACIDVLNATAARAVAGPFDVALPDAPWVLAVGFEDSEPAVKWQVQQLIRELTPVGIRGLEARAGTTAEPLWQALVRLISWPAASLTFKANLLPSEAPGFCLAAAQASEGLLVYAQAGSGIVRGHAEGLALEQARKLLGELSMRATARGGNLVLPRCPTPWKPHLPVWGLARGDQALMRQIKDKLDPRRLFNPGRFVGGI